MFVIKYHHRNQSSDKSHIKKCKKNINHNQQHFCACSQVCEHTWHTNIWLQCLLLLSVMRPFSWYFKWLEGMESNVFSKWFMTKEQKYILILGVTKKKLGKYVLCTFDTNCISWYSSIWITRIDRHKCINHKVHNSHTHYKNHPLLKGNSCIERPDMTT